MISARRAVAVSSAVGDSDGVGIDVGVAVGMSVGVAVGGGVSVAVGVGVGVGIGVGVSVGVGVGVNVGSAVGVLGMRVIGADVSMVWGVSSIQEIDKTATMPANTCAKNALRLERQRMI